MSNKQQFGGEYKLVEASLHSLGKILTGNTPSKKNEKYWKSKDIPFIKPGDIDDTEITVIKDGSDFISEAARGKARIAQPKSILVTCIGTIGKIAVVGKREVAFNQQINSISIDETIINPYYLAYALQANRQRLKILANAPVVPIINKSQFESFCLHIDETLEHQEEVVSTLDAIRCQQNSLKTIMAKLDQLVKSRFVEMFGDPFDNEKCWSEFPLGEMLDIARGGSPRPIKNYITDDQDGVNWIKIGDAIKGSRYIEKTTEKIKLSGVKKSRMVKSGDFLLSNSMSFGRPYILKTDGCIHDDWLVLHGVNRCFNSLFLYQLLASEGLLRKFSSLVRGGVVNNLNKDLVASVEVMCPPIELQNKFAAFVQKADKAKEIAQQQIEKLQTLYDSLAQDYFAS